MAKAKKKTRSVRKLRAEVKLLTELLYGQAESFQTALWLPRIETAEAMRRESEPSPGDWCFEKSTFRPHTQQRVGRLFKVENTEGATFERKWWLVGTDGSLFSWRNASFARLYTIQEKMPRSYPPEVLAEEKRRWVTAMLAKHFPEDATTFSPRGEND